MVGVSKVQQSTRYVNMNDFQYYIPPTVEQNSNAKKVYETLMKVIADGYTTLLNSGITKEDAANVLPLGSMTTIVLKINARAILHMAEIRLCNRALKEFRDLMNELLTTISNLDDEWAKIISYAKPKCEILGYCNEKKSCGKYPQKE